MKRKCQKEFYEYTQSHLPSLYNTSIYIIDNQNDANSLVRDTLYNAYHAYDQLQTKSDFRVWIFRILFRTFVNKNKNSIKQQQKLSYVDLEEFFLFKRLDEKIYLNETRKEELIENLDKDDLKNAYKNLPFQIRLIVVFNDVEGFSYEEIANILDVKLEMVKYKLYSGRKFLQRYLWENAKLFRFVHLNFFQTRDKKYLVPFLCAS